MKNHLCPGGQMPDFTYDTPYAKGRRLSETLRQTSGKTALVFLRFYGCRLTKYDLMQYAAHAAEISAEGQLLVVLQSDPELLRETLGEERLPFEVICDPTCALYDAFDIQEAADDTAAFKDSVTKAKRKAFLAAGIEGGAVEGRHLQMPAVFVMTPDGVLTAVRYGVSAGDSPDVEELLRLLK